MSPELELALKFQALSFTLDNDSVHMDSNPQYKDGWHDALKSLIEKESELTKWFNGLDKEIKSKVEFLLSEEFIDLKYDANNQILLYINANDTFAYASADSVDVKIEDLKGLCEASVFRGDGILAWMSIKTDCMPLKELQTERFKMAYNKLKGEINEELLGDH